jgi:hypothetical protein
MKISEVENIFKELFEEKKGLIKTVETVYEKSKNEEFYKLVISIHDLRVQDTLIIHTKFIFKTDLEKNNLLEDAFMYLYDINCIYHTKHFSDAFDLKKKVKNIVDANKFGKDIQTLSEFIDTPGVLISHYFRENNISNYSIGNVTYEPKFKIKPCEETTFDFIINVLNASNDYNIALCISKRKTETDKIQYKFRFRLLEEIESVEVDKLMNIHFLIGNKIVEMLDKILK